MKKLFAQRQSFLLLSALLLTLFFPPRLRAQTIPDFRWGRCSSLYGRTGWDAYSLSTSATIAWSHDQTVVAFFTVHSFVVLRASDGILLHQVVDTSAQDAGEGNTDAGFMPASFPSDPALAGCLVVFADHAASDPSKAHVSFFAPPVGQTWLSAWGNAPVRKVREYDIPLASADYSAALSADGKSFIAGGRLFDTSTGSVIEDVRNIYIPALGKYKSYYFSTITDDGNTALVTPTSDVAGAPNPDSIYWLFTMLVPLSSSVSPPLSLGQFNIPNFNPPNPPTIAYYSTPLVVSPDFHYAICFAKPDSFSPSASWLYGDYSDPVWDWLGPWRPAKLDPKDGDGSIADWFWRSWWAFSPDSSKFAMAGSGERSGFISPSSVYTLKNGTLSKIWEQPAPTGGLGATLRFSWDSQKLALAHTNYGGPEPDTYSSILDFSKSTIPTPVRLDWLSFYPGRIAYSPDSSLVAGFSIPQDTNHGVRTGSMVYIWDALTGAPVSAIPTPRNATAATFADNNTLLVGYGSDTDNLEAYYPRTGALLWTKTFAHQYGVYRLSDAAIGQYGGRVLITGDPSSPGYALTNAKGDLTPLNLPNADGNFAYLSPDGTKAMYYYWDASNGFRAYLADISDPAHTTSADLGRISSPAHSGNRGIWDDDSWSSDSTRVALGYGVQSETGIYIIDADKKTYHALPDSNTAGNWLVTAWPRCGNYLVVGGVASKPSSHYSLRFIDATSGKTLVEYTQEIGEDQGLPISGLRFSPNGQLLTYATYSGTVRTINNPLWTPPTPVSLTAPAQAGGGTKINASVNLSCFGEIGGTTVTFTASDPSVASFPSHVTIPADQSSATFPVTIAPLQGIKTLTLTATANGQSRSCTITINAAPRISLQTTLSRANGVITATVTVTNAGGGVANGVKITSATLGSVTTKTALPVSVGNLAAGQSATTVLTFEGSIGAPGTIKVLGLSGTFDIGTFGQSARVTLP